MGIRTSYPQMWLLGLVKYLPFKINGRSKKIILTLTYPSSPKIDHKVFVWKVPSLDLEERSILVSEDNWIARRILTNRTCYTHLISSNIKFLHNWALCSNLAKKHLNLFLLFSFPYEVFMTHETLNKLGPFLFLILCQLNFHTHSGTKNHKGVGKNLFVPSISKGELSLMHPVTWRRRRGHRGWDGWMASLTRWTWVWPSSESWWWTGKSACCSPWGCKESDTTEQLNWTELIVHKGEAE